MFPEAPSHARLGNFPMQASCSQPDSDDQADFAPWWWIIDIILERHALTQHLQLLYLLGSFGRLQAISYFAAGLPIFKYSAELVLLLACS